MFVIHQFSNNSLSLFESLIQEKDKLHDLILLTCPTIQRTRTTGPVMFPDLNSSSLEAIAFILTIYGLDRKIQNNSRFKFGLQLIECDLRYLPAAVRIFISLIPDYSATCSFMSPKLQLELIRQEHPLEMEQILRKIREDPNLSEGEKRYADLNL